MTLIFLKELILFLFTEVPPIAYPFQNLGVAKTLQGEYSTIDKMCTSKKKRELFLSN